LALTKINRQLGQVYEIKGDYKSALKGYFQSIALSKLTGQLREQALCFMGLSNINFRKANIEMALNNSIEAARIFKQNNDTSNFIAASALKAQVYLGLKKYSESLKIYNELLQLSIKTIDSLNIVYNTEHIEGVYSFMKKYDLALEYMNKALIINSKLYNPIYQGIIYGNMGEMYLRKGEFNNALNNLNNALEIEKAHDFNSGMIFLYYTLGETHSNIGKFRDANIYFEKSIQLIEKTGEVREKPIVFLLLSEHYARLGKFEEAFIYSKKHFEISDSLLTVSNLYRIEELKIRTDIEKSEQYQQLLNEKISKENELSSSKNIIRLQLLIIGLIGLGMISLLIFAFFILKNRRELDRANKTRKLLFSVIGHDLRGPMGNLKQLIDLILHSKDQEQQELIGMLKQPAETSMALLDNLLIWSQSSEKEMVFKPEKISISKVVNEVCNLLLPISAGKKIQVICDIPENIEVFADFNHLSTILRNLLSNAIKFTHINGQVKLSHEIGKNHVKISLTDNGVGIDQPTIKKILKTHSFFSSFGTQNEKGTGLGMGISKQLIKKNRGQLSIISEPGKGSTFAFTVPLFKN
jgi:signal transduction histidine kinase